MEMLLHSYRNDEAAIDEIIVARKALVDFYMSMLQYVLTTNVKDLESEISFDAYDAALKGVKTLNAMCMKKGIEPVYTGSYSKAQDVFMYAEMVTKSILTRAGEK